MCAQVASEVVAYVTEHPWFQFSCAHRLRPPARHFSRRAWMFQFSCAHRLRRVILCHMITNFCFNSHVRTGCVLSRVLFWYAEKGFNSHVRTGCVSPPTQRITPHRCFNSHVRTGCVSKNEQKPLLITINHAQLYCLNSSAHSVLLAIKGDLLLLHRCEPPYKIM